MQLPKNNQKNQIIKKQSSQISELTSPLERIRYFQNAKIILRKCKEVLS